MKLPKLITHTQRLVDCSELLDEFLAQVGALREKLSVLIVQLPPKFAFDCIVTRKFFLELTARTSAKIACEPRHPSWFQHEADTLLEQLGISRVAADPAICGAAAAPGGWSGLRYWRLHGSPVIYRSSYLEQIDSYALVLERELAVNREVWCIFDNTASSAAAGDAFALARAMKA